MVPKYVKAILVESKKFTQEELRAIYKKWDWYSQISFGSSTERQLIKEAEMVLRCIKH